MQSELLTILPLAYELTNGTVITGKFCVGVPLNIQSIYVQTQGQSSSLYIG